MLMYKYLLISNTYYDNLADNNGGAAEIECAKNCNKYPLTQGTTFPI